MSSFSQSDQGVLLAGIFALLAVLFATFNVFTHLSNYHTPHLQLWTVRIIGIVPIYALVSWISLYRPDEALYFNTVRDIYEAFVIYAFLRLILAYGGGENSSLVLMRNRGPLAHPCPLNLCFRPMLLDATFLRRCKKGCLQFVFLKPLFAVISLIFMAFDMYDSTLYQAILLTVYNISYTIALYYLFLFYLASREILREQHIVLKFFAVKTVVFLTYWQMLAVESWPNLTQEQGEAWNDFILCIEMFAFAVLHMKAFSCQDAKDSSNASISNSSVMRNVGQVVSLGDIVDDAFHNFSSKYQDYVQASNESATVIQMQEPKKYKTKSFVSDSFKSSSIVPAQSISTATVTEQDDDDEEKQSGFDGEMSLLHTRLREMENQALVGERAEL